MDVETLAKALADTRYLVLDPPMRDAYSKLSERTKDKYRLQAALLIERGVVNG